MIRKIVILTLLAGFLAVATQAMSQNPGTSTPEKSATPEKSVTPEKSFGTAPPVTKTDFAGQKLDPSAQKSELDKKISPSGTSAFGKDGTAKGETSSKGKDNPTGKETTSSKTFPTSSSASLLPSAIRK